MTPEETVSLAEAITFALENDTNLILIGYDFTDFLNPHHRDALSTLMVDGPGGILYGHRRGITLNLLDGFGSFNASILRYGNESREKYYSINSTDKKLKAGFVMGVWDDCAVFPVVSTQQPQQKRYRELRIYGVSHKIAKKLSLKV